MEVFRHVLPSDWGHVNFNRDYTLETIDRYSDLYCTLDRVVNGTFKEETLKIVKVINPYLYLQYALKKQEYEFRGDFEVKQLLHDTSANNVKSIVCHNLDHRLACRVKYGEGVSFSTSPVYANKQSSRNNGSKRAMIVADVLVGNIQEVKKRVPLPNVGFDTTRSVDRKVYVKYYDNEFYPKYIVYYNNRYDD